MERKKITILALKYAAYTFGIIVLFGILMPFITNSIAISQNLVLIILAAEMFLCCKEYKRNINSTLSFKQALSLSLNVSTFVGLLNSMFVVIFVLIVGKETIREGILKYKSLISNGLGEKEFNQVVNSLSSPLFLFFLTNLFYLFIGFFLSLVIALFAQTPANSISNEE